MPHQRHGRIPASKSPAEELLSSDVNPASVRPHITRQNRIALAHTTSDSAHIDWFRQYGSQDCPSTDNATAIAVDRFGNVFVTGSSSSISNGSDYSTIKYSPAGTRLWVARYDGGRDDAAYALGADSTGNVYVTGTSRSTTGEYDYVTVKYSTDGNQEWAVRTKVSLSDPYRPPALEVLGSGGVYLAAAQDMPNEGLSNALIARYSPGGTLVWSDQYAWPGTNSNRGMNLCLDNAGNVCVAGMTGDATTNTDYLVLKYTATGTRIWERRYDGPRHEDDRVASIAADASGNIFVTGSSQLGGTDPNWSDFSTLKYSPGGTLLWAKQYNGPANSGDMAYGIAVDDAGNACVVGRSDGQNGRGDFVALKYDASGTMVWLDRYNGAVNDYDEADAVTLDSSGNLYVTGMSRSYGTRYVSDDYFTIKYSPSGTRLWTARYDGTGSEYDDATAITVDRSGNVYVTGTSEAPGGNEDYATLKYTSAGTQEWVARYDGPRTSFERPRAFTVDAAGNMYITGSSGSAEAADYLTVKFNSEGSVQWSARYNGPGDWYDGPSAIKVDPAGNVYVTGESDGANSDRDFATIKYDASGAQQWVARYDGGRHGSDWATSLDVDVSGNVFVAGLSAQPDGGMALLTIKYDAQGRELWAIRGPSNASNVADLSIDASGKIYIISSTTMSSAGRDFLVVKYDPDGTLLWANSFDWGSQASDAANFMELDILGNCYIVGTSRTSTTMSDVVTAKIDQEGHLLWSARYDGPSTSPGIPYSDWPRGLAVDNMQNVYVAVSPFTLLKYDFRGRLVWERRYPTSDPYDGVSALALDVAGNIYITGSVPAFGGNTPLLIKYAPDGTLLWALELEAVAPFGVALTPSGGIYLAGQIGGPGWNMYTLMKCTQTMFSLRIPESSLLAQNFPNPVSASANHSTAITFQLSELSNVSLKVYDILGREISEVVGSTLSPGSYLAQWNGSSRPSGVYFYRLVVEPVGGAPADRIIQTKKLMLIR
ncbi:MAG: SBBP repeat-containing protein [Ignavibacteriales bacterium]|nr:SBBP repeat-containing protein [Ignavibacteriales bacterium]